MDLDSRVCCICSKSLIKKFSLHNVLVVILVILSIVGSILNTIYYSNFEDYFKLGIAAYAIHFITLTTMVIMNTYCMRYLFQSNIDDVNENATIPPHILVTYIVVWNYVLFSLILPYAVYALNRITKDLYVSALTMATKQAILYSVSLNVIWYWNVISRPMYDIWSNFHQNNPTTWNDRSKYIFYCEYKYALSYLNSGILVFYNFIMANLFFGLVRTEVKIYNLSIIIQSSLLFINIIVNIVIYFAPRDKGHDAYDINYVMYICMVIISIILFFVFLPYKGWTIDSEFVTSSRCRNYYYIVQGSISLLIVLYYILVGILSILKCCCVQTMNEISVAQNQLAGYQQNTNE